MVSLMVSERQNCSVAKNRTVRCRKDGTVRKVQKEQKVTETGDTSPTVLKAQTLYGVECHTIPQHEGPFIKGCQNVLTLQNLSRLCLPSKAPPFNTVRKEAGTLRRDLSSSLLSLTVFLSFFVTSVNNVSSQQPVKGGLSPLTSVPKLQ